MSDMKSKFPDLKELTSMATKLFTDVKNSVSDIIKTYKQQRERPPAEKNVAEATSEPSNTANEQQPKTPKETPKD